MKVVVSLLIVCMFGVTCLAWMQSRRISELKAEIRKSRLLHDDLAHYVHGPLCVAYGSPDGD